MPDMGKDMASCRCKRRTTDDLQRCRACSGPYVVCMLLHIHTRPASCMADTEDYQQPACMTALAETLPSVYSTLPPASF